MLATRMVVNISTGGRLSVCRHARGRACGSAGGGRQPAGGEQLALVACDDEVVLIVGEREVEGGGDVLVGAAVGHRDRAAENPQLMIGADEADELDPSALGPLVGQFRQRGRRPLGGFAACFVGGLPAGGAVAMLAVVEALERVGARAQMLDASETLLAEEALVERVVEVLDAAVAPRLTRRDEHGR